MPQPGPQGLGLLAKAVIACAVVLIIAGVAWRGVTVEAFHRIGRGLIERPSGPMGFRFVLQPTMVIIAALIDGVGDARTGRAPYFWTILRKPSERAGRLREGLNAIARVILLGLAMDLIYQVRIFGTLYPVEALLIAFLLTVIPYLVMRGLITRIARRWRDGTSPPGIS